MMEFFAALEQTGPSIFVRESLWAFPALLIAHALGMAFLVGPGLAIDLRVLGVAKAAPLRLFPRLFPVMQAGFVLALISGAALLLAYPAKALTNPVFYLKFAFLLAAGALTWALARRLMRGGTQEPKPVRVWARSAAAVCILMWTGAIFAGRFLAYTHSILMAH